MRGAVFGERCSVWASVGVLRSLRGDRSASRQITADVVATGDQTDNKKHKESDYPETTSSEASSTAGRASSVFDIAA